MQMLRGQLISVLLVAACVCLAQQEVRITELAAGNLRFTLVPAAGVSEYACRIEWCSDLRTKWTNGWYRPFETQYANANGLYSAAIPRFFRIVSRTDGPLSGGSEATNYVVTAVVPSVVANGIITWSGPSGGDRVYHVEFTSGAGDNWSGHWRDQANITAVSPATGSFQLPLRFRVVEIAPDDGVEYPW